jgi:7-cyano-7-deazaguanine synthase
MVPERSKQGQHDEVVAVLFSAGLDSAVLAADAARRAVVQPIYVRAGLAWEAEELGAANRLLASGALGPQARPLVVLGADMRDVYPASHWAVRGEAPGYDTADADVYLEGRNIVLLSKTAVFMARQGIERVLIGPLAGNPFPDATPRFFDAMQAALSLGLATRIVIEAPFASLSKADVIRLGVSLGVPLELTLSCMQPRGGRPCGTCSKCREREQGLAESLIPDPRIPHPRIP